MNVKIVARPSRAHITTGIAKLSTNAAARPKMRTSHENTATNIAKLMLDGFPANAEAMTLPIKPVMMIVKTSWATRSAICRPLPIVAVVYRIWRWGRGGVKAVG
jgi:hypothetical protein